MKNIFVRYIIPFAMALAAVGCNYKESFSYKGDELADFTADSLYFSFGKEPFAVQDTTMFIGVEIVGSPAPHDRRYRVRIDAEQTTAVADLHYDAFETDRTMPAEALSTTIPIRIHRLALDDETVYRLRLEMEPTDDFGLGVVEYRSVIICFTNRLDCPDWWNELSQWLGEYSVRKYQKFIELWGNPITSADVKENKYAILRTFKEVKAYFEAHPEYGERFPDVDWIV